MDSVDITQFGYQDMLRREERSDTLYDHDGLISPDLDVKFSSDRTIDFSNDLCDITEIDSEAETEIYLDDQIVL